MFASKIVCSKQLIYLHLSFTTALRLLCSICTAITHNDHLWEPFINTRGGTCTNCAQKATPGCSKTTTSNIESKFWNLDADHSFESRLTNFNLSLSLSPSDLTQHDCDITLMSVYHDCIRTRTAIPTPRDSAHASALRSPQRAV